MGTQSFHEPGVIVFRRGETDGRSYGFRTPICDVTCANREEQVRFVQVRVLVAGSRDGVLRDGSCVRDGASETALGAAPGRRVTRYSFLLYVAGNTERSKAAEANLRFLCDALVPRTYEVEVIDAAERPDLAEERSVLATPTVVRLAPPPQRRVIGDLSDHGRAAVALGLPNHEKLPPERQ